MKKPALALFDLDGTLTRNDTMFAFVRHAKGPIRTILGLAWLAPMLLGYAVGLVRNDRAKQTLLTHFFVGTDRETLVRWGASFADVLDGLLRPEAETRLQWHRERAHDVVIVSASLDLWVAPWAARRGLTLLCTKASFENERFTGAFEGENCHGAEKERRIRAALSLEQYETIHAYGDSSGDAEMLALADEAWFRPFRGEPLAEAQRS